MTAALARVRTYEQSADSLRMQVGRRHRQRQHGLQRLPRPLHPGGQAAQRRPLTATKKACPTTEASEQEAGYLSALESAARIEQAGPQLTLLNAKGQKESRCFQRLRKSSRPRNARRHRRSTARATGTAPSPLSAEFPSPVGPRLLRTGLQGFHGGRIAVPRRPEDRPDPHRLALRFGRFEKASA